MPDNILSSADVGIGLDHRQTIPVRNWASFNTKNDTLESDGLLWLADKSQDCNRMTAAQHDNADAASHVKTQRGAVRKDEY